MLHSLLYYCGNSLHRKLLEFHLLSIVGAGRHLSATFLGMLSCFSSIMQISVSVPICQSSVLLTLTDNNVAAETYFLSMNLCGKIHREFVSYKNCVTERIVSLKQLMLIEIVRPLWNVLTNYKSYTFQVNTNRNPSFTPGPVWSWKWSTRECLNTCCPL